MTGRQLLRQAWRETRGQRRQLAFFAGCLALGVMAVVAVAGLADSLDQTLRREAKRLLAADLVVSSRRPLPESIWQHIEALAGARAIDLVETNTIVAPLEGPARSSIVELKVAGEGFPLYGDLELEPARPLAEQLADGGTVVGPTLLDRLGVEVGERLKIGSATFEIRAVVTREPDRVTDAFAIGPRVFLDPTGLEAADLLGPGSRVMYRRQIRLAENPSADGVREVAEGLREAAGEDAPFLRIETYIDAQPALRRSLDRMERFLGLVALASLLVGGLGVAQATRTWLERRTDAIAILKCLGMRPPEIFRLYLLQSLLLGLSGSSLGAALGLALQQAVPTLLGPDLIPPEAIAWWQPAALARGLGLGLAVSLIFALEPLRRVLRVPAMRALRASAEPLPPARRELWIGRVLLAVGIWAFASLQAKSALLGLGFLGGLILALGLTTLATEGLRRLAERYRPGAGPTLRYALAALTRPAVDTLRSSLPLATGLFLLFGLFLTSLQLRQELEAALPDDAPSAFVVDVQPEQWPGVEATLREAGAERIESVPVVIARLRSLDGRPVDELAEAAKAAGNGDRRWALTREQRLTFRPELPEDNEITAGAWFSPEVSNEVSLEEDFARELGLELGSRVVFDIQGVPVEVTVTSLRTVDWRTFNINFFWLVEPETLEAAPRSILAATRLPAGSEPAAQAALVRQFPNVLLIPIRDVLDRLLGIIERLGVAVRALALFTVLAGLAILAGTLWTAAGRRGTEVALLKTLGSTRRRVAIRLWLEYAILGLVVGGLGTGAGTVLGWAIATRGMELGWTWRPGITLATLATTLVVIALLGALASRRALRVPPAEVLRRVD